MEKTIQSGGRHVTCLKFIYTDVPPPEKDQNELQILMSWETADCFWTDVGCHHSAVDWSTSAQTVAFEPTEALRDDSQQRGPEKQLLTCFFNLPCNFHFLQWVQDMPLKPSVVI